MADDEIEKMSEDEVKHDDDNGCHSLEPDTAFLIEMNLLTVFLSLVPRSGEDSSTIGGEERKGIRENEAKACISRIRNRRKDISEVKSGRQPPQRFHPLKDFK